MNTCKDCGKEKDWYERTFYNITYECSICGFQEKDDKEYYMNHYINDKYRKSSETYPEPKDWACPYHLEAPNSQKALLYDEIRAEPRTDDKEPYIREDDPEILEDIEMDGEMCFCGHEWDCHFPPWGAAEIARSCRFETCSCAQFELMEVEEDGKSEQV